VLRHLQLVLAPAPMEAQHGNAVLIDRLRADLAVALLVRDHLAAAGESDARAVALADRVLERLAITFVLAAGAVEGADLRDAQSAADLDVIAARELLVLFVELPPGHVDVHAADAVGVVARQALERGDVPAQSVANGVSEIAADLSGRVRNAI